MMTNVLVGYKRDPKLTTKPYIMFFFTCLFFVATTIHGLKVHNLTDAFGYLSWSDTFEANSRYVDGLRFNQYSFYDELAGGLKEDGLKNLLDVTISHTVDGVTYKMTGPFRSKKAAVHRFLLKDTSDGSITSFRTINDLIKAKTASSPDSKDAYVVDTEPAFIYVGTKGEFRAIIKARNGQTKDSILSEAKDYKGQPLPYKETTEMLKSVITISPKAHPIQLFGQSMPLEWNCLNVTEGDNGLRLSCELTTLMSNQETHSVQKMPMMLFKHDAKNHSISHVGDILVRWNSSNTVEGVSPMMFDFELPAKSFGSFLVCNRWARCKKVIVNNAGDHEYDQKMEAKNTTILTPGSVWFWCFIGIVAVAFIGLMTMIFMCLKRRQKAKKTRMNPVGEETGVRAMAANYMARWKK